MPIARDESLTPPIWPDAGRNRTGYKPPEVLFDDRFNGSFCGWRDHLSGTGSGVANIAPVSLTTLRTWADSRASLMLSTSGRGTTAAPNTAGVSTYKNLSRNIDSGIVRFEAWVGLGGCDMANSPYTWALTIDTQTWDASSRGFPRLQATRFTGGSLTTRKNAWAISGDAGETHYINLGGTDNGTSAPSSLYGSPPMMGDNQNKMNLMFVALAYDLTGVYSTDGKPGGYHHAIIGNRTYDLTGFGAGRRLQTPAGINGDDQGFQGGLNFGFTLSEKPAAPAGPSWLIVPRCRALWFAQES